MDIERARTFLAILSTGSFLKAAEQLHVTQTTISARVRTLEEELGRQLFIRNRNGTQLTAAGREFERYAQSLVQIWERARHQLAIPEGKISLIAIGCELSLWNPLLLDWLVWMRKAHPSIAIRAQVGSSEHLLEQVRTGVLDVAILYAPSVLPGIRAELLIEEQLVLVQSARKQEEPARDDYVYVDWGPLFEAQHSASAMPFGEPGLFVGLGPLGLFYILRVGGRGYFRKGVAAPYIVNGELELVPSAPEFLYPAYVVYAEENEARIDVQVALKGLRQVVGQ